MLCRGVPWFSSSPASAISMGHPFSTQISHAHSPSSVSSRHPVIRLWFSAWYDSFVYSPFLRAVTTISPLLSKSPRSCHATEAVSPPSYLIAHFSSSIATILPPCHLVTFLLFTQVIRSSVPCPRSSLMFAGTITSVSVPPPAFNRTHVPASDAISCHWLTPPAYSTHTLGSSFSCHSSAVVLPVSHAVLPSLLLFSVSTSVPTLGNHNPICPS